MAIKTDRHEVSQDNLEAWFDVSGMTCEIVA